MPGRHYCGWYYGDSHFIAKVLPFVLEGLALNAQFLVVLEPHILDLLERTLRANHVEVKPGTFVPLPLHELTELQRRQGARGLRTGIVRSVQRARGEGFHQIWIFGRVTFELSLTGSTLEQFLQWDRVFQRACAGLPVAALCMYDSSLSVDRATIAGYHDAIIDD